MPLIVKLFPSFVVAMAMAVAVPSARAVILEDFPFNDFNGALLEEAENVANPGNNWTVDPDLNNSSVLNGSFRVQHAGTLLESNYIDIANVTTGKLWLVAEIAGWSLSSDTANPNNYDPANPEEIRFAFLNNDNTPPSGSFLSGQVQFQRSSSGGFELIGNTAGAGGSNIVGSYPLSLTRSEPFIAVLEVDVTDTVEEYTVYYKDGSADFATLGTADIAPARNANSVRFAVRRSFAGDGEFFDVDRVYVTDVNPVGPVAPIALTLEVKSNGMVSIVNTTAFPVSFNSYRIGFTDPLTDDLNFAGWNSLSDQGIDAVGGGDDPGETWDEAGGSNDKVLAESFLLGSSTIAPTNSLSLGSAFQPGGAHQQLTFEYHDINLGSIITGEIDFVVVAGLEGDYNDDGVVDAGDYVVWRKDPASHGGDPGGYNTWRANFGMAQGSGSSPAATTVPEPASACLAAIVVLLTAVGRRHAQRRL